MNKIGFSLLAVAAALALASCSLEPPAMGHLSISVPSVGARALGDGASRAIVFGANDAPAIRIYVQLNGAFIQSARGKDYFQASLVATSRGDPNTIVIDLPPSSGYKVFAAIGATAEGWKAKYYGGTDKFSVSAGVYTKKSLQVAVTPFNAIFPSASDAFAAVVDGKLWRLVDSTLTDGTSSVDISALGLKVNSLSAGEWFGVEGFVPELWVNSDKGVYALRGGALTPLSATIGLGATGSGAIVADIDGKAGSLVAFFFGPDVEFAYSNVSTAAIDASWKSGGLKSYLASDKGKDFRDLITDPGAFLRASAFVVQGNASYGFISTAFGTYFYNAAVQQAMGTDVMGWLKNQLSSDSSAYLVSAISGAKSLPVTSLAFDAPSGAGTIYAGTAAGLYSVRVSASGAPASQSFDLLVPDVKVAKLAAAAFGTSTYAAYVDGMGNLAVLKDGAELMSYPFYSYSAFQSGVTSLNFWNDGSLKLVVTSPDGAAILTVAQ